MQQIFLRMLSSRYSQKRLQLSGSGGQADSRTWKEALWVGFSLSCLDVAAVTIAGLLSIWFFQGVYPTTEHGFYCDDASISRPFYENTTVPVGKLLTITISMPLLLIHVLEIASIIFLPDYSEKDLTTKITFFFYNSTPLILKYVAGFCTMVSTFELLKALCGELRPYFLTVCQPDWSKTGCVGKSNVADLYSSSAFCTNANHKLVRQARRSFPSGHAAAAFFASAFLYFYYKNVFYELDKYVKTARNGERIVILKKAVIVFMSAFFLWSCFCAYSRIIDYWHHPKDIFWGIGLGVTISAMFYRSK